MANTTISKRKRTTRAKSKASGPIEQPEANSHDVAETEAGKPGRDAEKASPPAASRKPLKKTRTERARGREATESDLVEQHPMETRPEDVQVEEGKPEVLVALANAPEEPTQQEAPFRGRTLVEACMNVPSFRAKVISRLIKKLR